MGIGGLFSWAPRSLDLTPCDFFLWGCIKEKVYREAPENITGIKVNIIHAIARLTEVNTSKSVRKPRNQAFIFNLLE